VKSSDLVGEFEIEPMLGLPEVLPSGEELLWQGSPSWKSLARRAFHTGKVAAYFLVLLIWRVVDGMVDGQSVLEAATAAALLVPLALVAVGILAGLAFIHSRATVYTITNRRVVIRFGVAFVMAVNFPFRKIQSASMRPYPDGTGDIPLFVSGADRLGYFMLWPHARPWRFGRNVQPMLRCVPDAKSVADTLARALAAASLPNAGALGRPAPKSAAPPSLMAAAS
jgi:hypothetical protein